MTTEGDLSNEVFNPIGQLNETHTHTGLTSLVHDGFQRLQCQLVGYVQVVG